MDEENNPAKQTPNPEKSNNMVVTIKELLYFEKI